jgi:hypothetical protein
MPDAYQPAALATWWGALNAVTAWVDHVQEIDGHRFAHVMFGSGTDLKGGALIEALAAAKVD